MAYIELPVRTRGVCCDVELAVAPGEVGDTVDVLKALADPTRLSMLKTLHKHGEPVCICDLLSLFDLSQPTLSHHMGVLKRAGLVSSEKRGLWVHYRVPAELPVWVAALMKA